MRFISIPPPRSLQHVVKGYYVVESAGGRAHPFVSHMLADGHIEFSVNFKTPLARVSSDGTPNEGTRFPGAYIGHIMHQAEMVRATGPVGFIAVKVRFGAAPSLLAMPISELARGPIPLAAVFGERAVQLEDRIRRASSHRDRVEALNRFVGYLAHTAQHEDDL